MIRLGVELAAVPNEVRQACAWVAERARSARIEEEAIAAYADALPTVADLVPPDPRTELVSGDRETRAAFTICLDAINFGSGWWPTIRKRPGLSGYGTIAAGLVERFRAYGAWPVGEMRRLEADRVAFELEQDAAHPLMAEFARSLRDVGAHVGDEHGGSFAALADAAGGSSARLATELAGWDSFADACSYDGRLVPFFKRAQLAAADIARSGVARFDDLHRLTAFADNLVPHVLRVDGVLTLDPELERRIDAGELLVHGSPEEVELRAAAVQAVELIAAARPGQLTSAEIDALLWNRGQEPHYKAIPRPRCRNTAY
jgi:hypothetical protein